jgi:hypothetical protein
MKKLAKLGVVLFLLSLSRAAPAELKVEIRDLKVEDNLYTPYYRVETGRDHTRAAAKKWIRLSVEFETDGEWIDDITINHFLYSSGFNGKMPVIMSRTVEYINIKPGAHHSYVYLHPNYVERYDISAFDLDAAASIVVNGREVARTETTKYGDENWSKQMQTVVHKGHLLDHSETPFWFINYDFNEVIRRAPHRHINRTE